MSIAKNNGLYAEMDEQEKLDVYIYRSIEWEDRWLIEYLCKDIRRAAEHKTPIVVHLNTDGGSAIQAYAICNALNDALAAGCTVETRNEGLAASMGAVIAQYASPGQRKACRNSLAMIHNVSSEGEETDLSKKLSGQIVDHFVKTTGLSKEVIAAMMAKTTWFDADEWVAQGFGDAVIEPVLPGDVKKQAAQAGSDVKKLINLFMSVKNEGGAGGGATTYQEQIAALQARLAELEGKASAGQQTGALDARTEMARILTLPGETEQIAALQGVFDRQRDLQQQIAARDARIAELEGQRVETMIAAARESGRITSDDEAASLRALATTNFDAVRGMLATRKPAIRPSDLIAKAIQGDDRRDWTLEDWQGRDMSGLNEMQDSNPAKYQALVDNYLERAKRA